MAYETYGTLNEARDNAVFICHALTGDAHAAGHHGDPSRPGWWDNLIGPGRAVDTDRCFVVSPNLLGGCQGTTGPSSTDPATGRAYGMGFPLLSMSDLVTVHRRLLDHLGIERLHAAVGGSLGGMQILQWAIDAPGQVERAVLVAASSRLTAQNIAFSAVARTAILRDPEFHDGQYAALRHPPRRRAVGRPDDGAHHLRLRAPARREVRPRASRTTARRGWAPTSRSSPTSTTRPARSSTGSTRNTYLYLTRVMDYFDPFADPDAASRAAAYGTRFLALSFDSDWRFPTHHSARLHEHLLAAGGDSVHVDLASPWGHDSFLLQPPGYHEQIAHFLERD